VGRGSDVPPHCCRCLLATCARARSQESRNPPAATYTGLQETDDYIDDAMDSYEQSLEYQD
jgi:hypothetical protein